ncbi:sucrose nonfermenting 4-like protein isoform X1 [Cryptomeria japonica]|uniref:sucrose nonfermenting 4-like protein isoform X1 n=1 Tax=Cryptomeria japonica TaxID=3369 RepID=UPI0025AD2B87|nr:sucrose nonfermenting 4-like protein isoform X1 [Cryptomeria japonica]
MFPTGNELASSSGGIPSVLVPTRFVWPHGGRRVYLVGSFTSRWTETLPMSPVEGCPSVFQIVCSLVPGLHQYKFIVDGDCRHDDQQPTMTPTFGTVNNFLFVTAPELPTAVVTPELPGMESQMEVDLIRRVTLSDDTLQEQVQRISQAEIEVSRRRIVDFLSSHTAYELLPDSGKVFALEVTLPVKQAFHILYEQGIPVAPLWDARRGEFVGMLSASDFITILKEIGNYGAMLSEEELETHTIAAWKDRKVFINRQMDSSTLPYWRPLVYVSPHDSLKDVAQKILQNEVATVPVIYSSSEDGSSQQLLHLASLSGILKCICRHFRHASSSLPLMQQPISQVPTGTWIPEIGEVGGRPLQMLRPNASLNSALSLLLKAQVSAIPIVDENFSLVDIYSRSDITALAKDRAYAQVQIDKINIQQALQLGQDRNTSVGSFGGRRCHMCLRSDTLQKVMECLANPGVRRVICVEAGSNRVQGIISLSDIFKFLLG